MLIRSLQRIRPSFSEGVKTEDRQTALIQGIECVVSVCYADEQGAAEASLTGRSVEVACFCGTNDEQMLSKYVTQGTILS